MHGRDSRGDVLPDGRSLLREPVPALRPFVSQLWSSTPKERSAMVAGVREHVLPTGAMHLVFRLDDAPLRLYAGPADRAGWPVGTALVGGARATYYVRDISAPSASVGAMLCPGASRALFGAHAGELAGTHTRLDDLWGPAAAELRQRLAAATGHATRLALLEDELLRRLAGAAPAHAVVVDALARFRDGDPVGAVVERSGYSHRHFIELFRRAAGLAPKTYCRVLRFQAALRAGYAGAGNYSDQAHFSREFRAIAGLSPGGYTALAPASPNHVRLPLGPDRSDSFKT